jgi:hypothetical protein
MVAAVQRCVCPECGAVCRGRFQGCPSVWTTGPEALSLGRQVAGEGSVNPGSRSGVGNTGLGVSHAAPTLPPDDPPLIAHDGPVVVGPLEPKAITDLAQALADAIATVGRQLHEDQELQLRSLLEKIESRLDELMAASREPLPIAPNDRQSGPRVVTSRTGTASNRR